MRTRDRLADELLKAAALASAPNAEKYKALAKRALTGEFDDYGDAHACPITALHTELKAAGFNQFAKRVADGEFDATREESDEWAKSPSGQEAFAMLRGQHPPGHTLGDAPIEPQHVDVMKDLGHFVDDMFNGADAKHPKVGFILMVFPLNDHEGRCNYISNAQRQDIVILLKEQIARFEGQPHVTGHA